MYRNIAHFPNLTPLRFVAAFLVLIFHVEETREMFGLSNLTRFSVFQNGPLAVTFFFVLSGFLITYLLLRETDRYHDINVTRFYVRRVLRIWPLYFLMVFVGLVLIPAGVKLGRVPYDAPFQSSEVAAYFILFVPFVVNLTYGNHMLTPLWSVGVEEMYYLGWAPIVKWFRSRLPLIMWTTVAIKAGLAVWASLYWGQLARETLRMLQFEAMALGGIAAYLVFTARRPIHDMLIFSRPVQLTLVLVLLVRLLSHNAAAQYSPLYAALFGETVVAPLLLMTLFAWFIVNVAVNQRTIVQLDCRVLNYLGDLSYGIYMYHALMISLVLVPFLDDYREAPGAANFILLHVLVAVLTIVVAAFSKKFFENGFMRYKSRFEAGDGRAPIAGSVYGAAKHAAAVADNVAA